MCWHKWSKWETEKKAFYSKGYKDKDGNFIRFLKEVQRRVCLKCGYQEIEENLTP